MCRIVQDVGIIYARRDICRITAIMKVEIDIITSIETSLIARAVILIIVFVDMFKTDAIVFIQKQVLF
jgi:hypothetical protein